MRGQILPLRWQSRGSAIGPITQNIFRLTGLSAAAFGSNVMRAAPSAWLEAADDKGAAIAHFERPINLLLQTSSKKCFGSVGALLPQHGGGFVSIRGFA